MKIYTKTGDTGTTSLIGGKRVSKANIQVDTYGNTDELNSSIGYFISLYGEELSKEYKNLLYQIQRNLFKIGTLLSFDFSTKQKCTYSFIEQKDVNTLEEQIDAMQETLLPLRGFILPGGAPSAAYVHMLRCYCRRCERKMVQFYEQAKMEKDPNAEMFKLALGYINRLADFFYILARFLNKDKKREEPLV